MQQTSEIKELIQLKSSDIKTLKEKWYYENKGICPILKKEISLEKTVIDHLHKLKSEEAGVDGKGCCRDAIEFRANALEGKITNNFKRLGLDKEIDLPTFLRNLADYLENNHLNDNILYIHPSEKVKEKTVSKSNYNKLKKLYTQEKRKAKFPEYPASGKLTKPLEKLFTEFGINPFN